MGRKLLCLCLVWCWVACDESTRSEPWEEDAIAPDLSEILPDAEAPEATDGQDLTPDLDGAELVPSDVHPDTTDSVDAGDLPDTGDLAPPAPPCVVTWRNASDDPIDTCHIDPRTMLGCDALARCVCEMADRHGDGIVDVEQCAFALVIPRGAITMADYCAYSGTAPRSGALSDLPWQELGLPVGRDGHLHFSAACAEIATFTLFGEAAAAAFSRLDPEQRPPDEPYAPLSDFALLAPPLFDLDAIESYTAATQQLYLDSDAAARLAALAPEVFLGNPFLIHSPTYPLVWGRFVSQFMAAVIPGPVCLREDLVAAHYRVLTLQNGHPSGEPFAEPLPLAALGYRVAARGRQLDAACISSCGCPEGRACDNGRCAPRTWGCLSAADCCLGQCVNGACQ